MGQTDSVAPNEPPATLRLPATLDTLAALGVAAGLRDRLATTPRPRVDAGAVEQVGLVALQLLHALGGSIELIDAATLDRGRRDAGLDGEPLLAGRALALRFDDAALRFGGEPLAALAALRAAGAGIAAILPAELASRVLAEPDTLHIRFRLGLPDTLDREAVERILEPFEASSHIDWDPIAPPAVTVAAAPAMVAVARDKLDTLAALVADLAAGQSLLVERLGPQAARLDAEIAEIDRTIRALQDSVVVIAMSRLDALVATLPRRIAIDGGATEIDRAVFDRIAPALDALVAATGGATLAAADDGGFVRLRLTLAAPGDVVALRDVTRALGGRLDMDGDRDGDGHGIDLRLPRSLLLLDAIIVEVGAAAYAVPVNHMVEALRPEPGDLQRLGPDRLLLRFRERYVPVLALGAHFGTDGWERDPCAAVLIVVHAGDHVIALMADTISDQRQVTVKPLGGGVAPPPGIASAAIVGGNRVVLTLDLFAFEPPATGAPGPRS